MKANTILFVLHIDENVEVIYVSPVRLGEDVLQYYTHLLGLQTAIELGDASAPESHCAKRFTILMPEALEYFSVWCTTYTHTPTVDVDTSCLPSKWFLKYSGAHEFVNNFHSIIWFISHL